MKATSTNIIYITRDLERALGLALETKGYYIISNYSAFAKRLVKGKKNVLLIKSGKVLDTRELLAHQRVMKFVNALKNPQILVFKSTVQIERICADRGWQLLNPSAELASKVEEKINGTYWLGDLAKFLPPHKIILGKELEWRGEEFIVQFNRAHTGSGTILIQSAGDLKEIKEKFPEREVRVLKYINGPMFTNNNVVWGKKVLCGNISYQITGMEPFTKRPFATVGNDWALPNKILNAAQKKEYLIMATAIGKKLASEGWKGEFGIDVIMDEKTGKLFLIEINARQPASTSCESWLQNEERKILPKEKTEKLLTTFEAHLLSLLSEKFQGEKLVKIKSGGQIVQKVMPESIKKDQKLLAQNARDASKQGWKVFLHDNYEIERDWIRLQTKNGLLERYKLLNEHGVTAMFFVTHCLYRDKWGTQKRAGAIVVQNQKILILKRHRFDNDYYCLPGGHSEKGESAKQTAIREIREETSLEIVLAKKQPIELISAGQKEYYFFVDSFSGEPILSGEEKGYNQPGNSYELGWVDIKDLEKINLLPLELKNELVKILK